MLLCSALLLLRPSVDFRRLFCFLFSLLCSSLLLFLFALWTYLKIVLSLVTFCTVAVVVVPFLAVAVYCVNMKVERKKRR